MIFSISVTYNPDITLLERQIDSLYEEVDRIIIVDNASSNINQLRGSIASKQAEGKTEIVFISNSKNTGLGRAQNIGLKKALELGADDLLLLDQDSILTDGFINNLLFDREDLLKKGIRVGALGPIYFNEATGEVYPITKYWGPFIKRLKPNKSPEEASFLIASGCFINKKVLSDVGFMNESLFIDCIDIDWSFRVRGKGYKLFASPRALMMHTIGEKRTNVFGRSIAIHSPLRRYYLFRNSVFLVRDKNIPIGYKVREIVFNTLRLLVYFTISKERIKYIKYSLRGFKDGINNVGGECPYKY
jgi:rhamnosyltransferase